MYSDLLSRTTLMGSLALALSLSGCGGTDSASTAGTGSVTFTGLAATGAGIANGTVNVHCASGLPYTGTTDGNGVFTLTLGTDRTLPCMLKVSGGIPNVTLYSFAQASGRVNITPATDLVVARALGADPDVNFNTFSPANGKTIEANLKAAKTYVNQQLSDITGSTFGKDLLTGAFAVGDADDDILEALGAAMNAAGQTVAQLRPAAQGNIGISSSVPAFLNVPANPNATANSTSQITLTWTAVAGATGYNIYRANTSGVAITDGNKITTTPVTGIGGYADTGLSASTRYFYKVVAKNSVAVSLGSAEVSATTSTANGGGGGSGLTCDTSQFGPGAAVTTPTAEQLASFARTYTGSEGSYGPNPGDSFVATGSATLVLNTNGTATYNGDNYTPTSYCLETLTGSAGTQLVIHAGAMSHFDLKTSGAWSGYTSAGKVVTDAAYSGGGGNASLGSLAISGNPVGIAGAAVPSAFNPTAYGTHPTAAVSWSMPGGATPWYVSINGHVVTSGSAFGAWQKQVVLAGVESLGVSFDLPNGHITFTNVSLPPFSVAQTGTMTLNGTLNVPPATGSAVTITGTGTHAAGTGLDAPSASWQTFLIGSTTKNIYTWNGGKGVSIQLDSYSNGLKTVTLTNSAGPSWRILDAGATVNVNTSAKTVTFSTASLSGISPTTSSITLNGTLTLP